MYKMKLSGELKQYTDHLKGLWNYYRTRDLDTEFIQWGCYIVQTFQLKSKDYILHWVHRHHIWFCFCKWKTVYWISLPFICRSVRPVLPCLVLSLQIIFQFCLSKYILDIITMIQYVMFYFILHILIKLFSWFSLFW